VTRDATPEASSARTSDKAARSPTMVGDPPAHSPPIRRSVRQHWRRRNGACLIRRKFEKEFGPDVGMWQTTESFERDYSDFCSRQRLTIQCKSPFKKNCRYNETLKWSQAKSNKKKVKEIELETKSLSGDGGSTPSVLA